jgi:hypothetical protein
MPYFNACRALNRDRPMLGGMMVVPLPVPRTMIEAHARRLRIEEHDIHEFVEIVAACDDIFVEVENTRIAAEQKTATAKRGRKER